MTDELNDQVSVCDWVTAYPSCATVFEKYKIDYCCGGNLSLKNACLEKELDVFLVESALHLSFQKSTEDKINWKELSLAQIIDNIVKVHHKYLIKELPSLSLLIEKVASKHGEHYPELIQLQQVFSAFSKEIFSHMEKEESKLFPLILQLESDNATLRPVIKELIAELDQEHIDAGNALQKMRTLTHDYSVSSVGCTSHKVLISRLHALESDMFRHIHKENHILFPRSLKID